MTRIPDITSIKKNKDVLNNNKYDSESKNKMKKYIPKIKLVEEPERPKSTPPTTIITTVEEAKIYKSTENEPKDGEKTENYSNSFFDKDFPNFFSRFKQIFGNFQRPFFVK